MWLPPKSLFRNQKCAIFDGHICAISHGRQQRTRNFSRFRLSGATFDLPLPGDPEPQELPLPGPAHSSLARVHLQPQMLRDPLRQVPDHSIRRGRSPYVDVTVVRVAYEAVPASLQFFVQRVQVEVRQQRGEHSTNTKGNFVFDRVCKYSRKG